MDNKNYHVFNTFRGLGALLVIFYHYFVYFFSEQEICAWLIDRPAVKLTDPFYFQSLMDFPLNTGHLGVTFFYVMSGFLIIPSLERYPKIKDFIIHKLFRLWPTFAVSLTVGVGFIAAYHWWHDTDSPITLEHYLACLFWARDYMHYALIDPVIWVLEIQLKFYLFALIMWHLAKKEYLEKICLVTIILSFIAYGLHTLYVDEAPSWFYLVNLAKKNLKFFVLILMGTCFYQYQSKAISLMKTLFLCALLTLTFLSPLFRMSALPFTMSYIVGTAIIAYFVFANKLMTSKKGRLNHVIDWVASVSYPSYLGHVLPGYVFMYLAIEAGYSVFWGMGIALIYVAFYAQIVHKWIEVSFIKLNKNLSSSGSQFSKG